MKRKDMEPTFPMREHNSKAIPIREVKEILEACFNAQEWDKLSDQKQDEIVNRLTRICEVIHANAESSLASKCIDFLKRC